MPGDYNDNLINSYEAIRKSYEGMAKLIDDSFTNIAEGMVNGTNLDAIFDKVMSYQEKIKSTFKGINDTIKNFGVLEETNAKKRIDNENKYYNARIQHQREFVKLQNQAINEIYAKYRKEEKTINDIYNSNSRLKKQIELDLINEMSNKYKTLNSEQLNGSINVAKKELELQKKIYDQKGEWSKKDFNEYVKIQQEKENLEIKSIEKAYEKRKQFRDLLAKGTANLITGVLDKAIDTYVMNNVRNALSEMQSAYETNFTAIAGRTGYQNRQTTHDFIYSGFTTMKENNLMGSLNYNTEFIPALVEATSKGFMGEEAIEVAMSNAIDKKIMPWLDTSSELWTQMQWSLSSDSLRQIKGQELLLQESRAGNRLLQSGVIDSLLNGLEPLLLQIDTNTNPIKLAEYMAKAEYIKSVAPEMTTSEITGYLNKAIQLESARGAGNMITSNNPADIYAAIRYGMGATPLEAIGDSASLFGGMGTTGNPLVDGIVLNTVASGWDFIDIYARDYETFNKKLSALDHDISYEELNQSALEAINKYNETLANSNSYVTATTEYDNKMKNTITNALDSSQMIAHGADWLEQGVKLLTDIKHLLISDILGNGLTNLFGRKFNKVGGSGKSNLFGSTGKLAGIGSKIKSNSSSAGLAVKNIGAGGHSILGNLAQFNSTLPGIATNLGVATAGGLIANKGINDWKKDNEILNNSSTTINEKNIAKSGVNKASEIAMIGGGATAAIAGGTAAIAGIAGAAGLGGAGLAALGAAAGPVGWIALGVAGVGLIGKTIYDGLSNVSGAAEQVELEYNERIKAIKDQNRQEKITWANISTQLDETENLTEKQNLLINSGLLSEEDVNIARQANAEELDKLTSAYSKAANEFNKEFDTDIQKYKKEDRATTEAQQLGLRNYLNEKVDNNQVTEDILSAADAALYTLFEDLEKRKGAGEEFDKHTQRTYKELSKAYLDGDLTKTELHDIIDEGYFNDSLEKAKFSSDIMNSAFENFINIGGSSIESGIKNWITDNGYTLGTYHGADRATDAISLANKALTQQTLEGAKEYLDQAKSKGYKSSEFSEIGEAANKWGLTGYRVGSSYIPYDTLAWVHAGERIMNQAQNTQYTQEISTGGSSMVASGARDIIAAIQQQTTQILDFLSTNMSSTSFTNSRLSIVPTMGQTRLFEGI